jgi:glycosyltransferase involved in cell wall biosynthesis
LGSNDDRIVGKRKYANVKKLFILGQLEVGGTENQVLMILKSMVIKKEQVELISFRGGPGEEFLRRENIPYRILAPIEKHNNRTFRKVQSVIELARILNTSERFLIEAFLPQVCIVTILINLALQKQHKIIVNRRSLYFYRKNRVFKILDKTASKKADYVIANSKAVYDDIIKFDKINPSKIQIIPNGIEIFEINKTPLENPNIYCIANLHKYKDHKILVEAFNVISSNFPQTNLIIYGDGPELRNLQLQINHLNLSSRVSLVGLEIDAKYQLVPESVFVLPSKTEGMSNALMEAMTVGMACIARNVGGNTELMGEAGIILPAKHEHLLPDFLAEVLRDGDYRKRLSNMARDRIKLNYSIEKVVAHRIAAHEKVLRWKNSA